MPPDLALLSTLIGSNYPCLELIFMVPKVLKVFLSSTVYFSGFRTNDCPPYIHYTADVFLLGCEFREDWYPSVAGP